MINTNTRQPVSSGIIPVSPVQFGSAVPEVTDATFQQKVLEASKTRPVLVDFFATWCGPCKMLAPMLDRVAPKYAGKVDIVKVDVDKNPVSIATHGIRSMPTLVLFQNGQETDRIVGLRAPEIRALLDKASK